MAELSRNGFVLIAFGGMNLCMKLREKMERHYQEEYGRNLKNEYKSCIQNYHSRKASQKTQIEPGFKTALLIWKEIKKLEKEKEI